MVYHDGLGKRLAMNAVYSWDVAGAVMMMETASTVITGQGLAGLAVARNLVYGMITHVMIVEGTREKFARTNNTHWPAKLTLY